jgi:segregation and condensation protein A
MPTTPDEPDRPRRRLGRGAAPDPEPAAADPWGPAVAATPDAPRSADTEPVIPEPVISEATEPAEPAEPVIPEPEPVSGPAADEEPDAGPVPEPAPAVESGEAAPAVESGEPAPVGEAAEPVAAGQPPGAADSGPTGEPAENGGRFTVRLVNFEGPFDLLLGLISKHKLDVTEVALSKVTNEFMAYIHAMGPDWDLDQTTEFLVVAATLLDLKAARLLPSAEVEDEADLALLEARDLLFARLLQYRAYKQIAAIFAERLEQEALRHPRTVGLEPQHAELLPEVVLSIGPERFAQLAVKAMQPKPKPQVYVDHIHAPLVSVQEQAEHVIALLRELGAASFLELTRDAPDTLTVVARFLALLELYREKAVTLDQEEALGDLQVRWTGVAEETGAPLVTDEFDRPHSVEPELAEKPSEKPAGKPDQKPAAKGDQR